MQRRQSRAPPGRLRLLSSNAEIPLGGPCQLMCECVLKGVKGVYQRSVREPVAESPQGLRSAQSWQSARQASSRYTAGARGGDDHHPLRLTLRISAVSKLRSRCARLASQESGPASCWRASRNLLPSSWNRFGQSELNDGQRAFEECCHAPSHISGRKPLRTPRPDRWTRSPLVNRSGRRNSFGHLVDGLRLRRRGPISPLTGGTRAARGGRAGRDEKISQAGVRVGGEQ